MEKTFLVYNIEWDTDGNRDALKALPKMAKCKIEIDDNDGLDDILSDYLSDEYGFCHYGFDYLEIDYNKPVEIPTQFGEITIESLNYDHHKPCNREEEDRIKVYDSDGNYFDHWSIDVLRDSALCNRKGDKLEEAICKAYDNLIKGYLGQCGYIQDFLDNYCVDYEFTGSKEEMIKYLKNTLNWENAEEAVSKEHRNEYINRIGCNYILIYQE